MCVVAYHSLSGQWKEFPSLRTFLNVWINAPISQFETEAVSPKTTDMNITKQHPIPNSVPYTDTVPLILFSVPQACIHLVDAFYQM